MFVLGLTGSIGMGKSATAAMFRAAGVKVHDSDAAVHALYRGAAAPLIEAEFPGTVRGGSVDRQALAARVLGNAAAMARLEHIVHPLVRADRLAFLAEARAAGEALVVVDIPLLYESGAEKEVDKVLLVTASEDVQKARIAGRPGMTEAKLAAIMARQMPDRDKRARADFIIDTSGAIADTERQVRELLRRLKAEIGDAGNRDRHGDDRA
ncbi:MAG TPA: dephospho-CoA kinase [Methylovirgula sp.]|nr:dephospho-CoA kinase [Methylovirgula sp.]